MCPSFQVSGNSHLSTGGRVKLLVAAVQRPAPGSPARPTLAEAMELCVSCKGCKRECEANVDMALIRLNIWPSVLRGEGLRLRDRLFAHTPRWLHRAPWLKPLIRWRKPQSPTGPLERALDRTQRQTPTSRASTSAVHFL